VEETFYDQVGVTRFLNAWSRTSTPRSRKAIFCADVPEDLTDSKRHFEMFLEQYWGGPKRYFEERGHPRLRMRHVPFRINRAARDAWLDAMATALEREHGGLSEDQFNELHGYFDMAAHQMRNV